MPDTLQPTLETPRLWLRPEGIVAEAPGGGILLDVHHRAHPRSRNREGGNAISFGSLAACAEVRERFHSGLWDGIAGESVLLDLEEKADGLWIINGLCFGVRNLPQGARPRSRPPGRLVLRRRLPARHSGPALPGQCRADR